MIEVTDLKRAINGRMARALTRSLGYDLGPDRIGRISETAARVIDLGFAVPDSFTFAIDKELLLYGDPRASSYQIQGILK